MKRKHFKPRKVYMAVRIQRDGMPVLVVALGGWPMGTVSLWAKNTMVAPLVHLDETGDVIFGEFVERAPKRRAHPRRAPAKKARMR